MKKSIIIFALLLVFIHITTASRELFLTEAFGPAGIAPDHPAGHSVSNTVYLEERAAYGREASAAPSVYTGKNVSEKTSFTDTSNRQRLKNIYNNYDKHTFEYFLFKLNYYLIELAIVLVILGILAAYIARLRRKHRVSIKSNELRLHNITNNINGGVLVLLPQKGNRITFVNDGYLKMLQYSREEFNSTKESEYLSFVHPDDIEELHKLIKHRKKECGKSNSFSAQLRLKRKDGKYVPTIFNGSLIRNEQGEDELYCVVMDISREHSIMERLEFEQERYRTLLEKSDEILYEVNFEEQTISTSNKFKDKFGWTLPEKYWGAEIPDLLHIHEDDRDEFAEMLKKINEDIIDGECIVRVYKSDFTALWCKIFFHVMKKNGKRIWLIGKLTDIDGEMREKQALLHKAQTDAMTGLYNKESFKTLCKEFFASSPNANCALIFFDLDNFKDINDNLGHAMGDKALKNISERLQRIFSPGDILGRFGGDEFCVLVKSVYPGKLEPILNRMVGDLKGEYKNEYHTVSITASIGAVCSYEHGNDLEKLLEYADRALYCAKENGKDGYVLYYDGLCLNGYTGR
ncbi:MAG: diguanylate cyclase [Clostridiales bacterium]|jgi:diguanylate cyclase (GGDEF)-like protein/PAS domain S-box-containing protein|nr:diguanylate cyclase [Clostridiales bacterium]